MSVGIVGSGAFGTALAVSLSCKYSDVILWGVIRTTCVI